jgi:restriction system protein
MIDIDFQQIITLFKTTIIGLFALWKVWLLLGAIALIRAIPYFWERYQLAKSGIPEIDKMTGKTFEKRLEILFKKLGYQVTRTGKVNDDGADLIIEKDGLKTAVQAKRWKGKVGKAALYEVLGGQRSYNCDKELVVTNSFFTNQAKEFAQKTNVELWDRKKLVKQLLSTQETNTKSTPTQTKAPKKICITCGKPVSDKVYQYCLDHPQLFKGGIYCFDCQKKS